MRPTCALASASTLREPLVAAAGMRFNQGVTERLKAELDVATAELRAHMAGWEFAFAMAGGAYGGREHPAHVETRKLTERLQARCRDLQAALAEHEL